MQFQKMLFQVIARLDDISIALENLHVLLSDQMNLYQKSINDREIEMSRKKILERLFFEHSSRYNSPTESPFLPITPPAMLPSPSNNPSTIFELGKLYLMAKFKLKKERDHSFNKKMRI